jgi:hypothetical protein
LEWCFGVNGNAEIGVGLAAAAAPVFLAMSLLPECHRWSERAILALDDAARGGLEEMHLQAALGVSLMFTRGGIDAARVALNRSFAIAEEHGDALDQLRLLGPLNMFQSAHRRFQTALHYAKRCSAIAGTVEDSVAALAHSILGISLHLSGDLGGARAELEAALRMSRAPSGPRRSISASRAKFSRRYPGEEPVVARPSRSGGGTRTSDDQGRRRMDHSLTLSIALIWGISVFLWTGDLESAEEHIDWLISAPNPIPWRPILRLGAASKERWPSAEATQKAELRVCRAVWRSSTQCLTSC